MGGRSFRQILPGNQDEALVLEKLSEFRTAHQIEIILLPFRAPFGMIGGGALHLGVVVRQMDNQLVRTGRKRLQHFFVRAEPLGSQPPRPLTAPGPSSIL